jgi:5-carboxymethyl-2-hydroxymuconate isomerase
VPHLTLEYTSNLAREAPTSELLLQLHRLLESAAGVPVGNCKSRWRKLEEWAVGDGGVESAFVHLDIRLLEGRAPEVLSETGRSVLDILKSHFLPGPQGREVQITIEIQEIRRDAYFKEPDGTLTPPPAV